MRQRDICGRTHAHAHARTRARKHTGSAGAAQPPPLLQHTYACTRTPSLRLHWRGFKGAATAGDCGVVLRGGSRRCCHGSVFVLAPLQADKDSFACFRLLRKPMTSRWSYSRHCKRVRVRRCAVWSDQAGGRGLVAKGGRGGSCGRRACVGHRRAPGLKPASRPSCPSVHHAHLIIRVGIASLSSESASRPPLSPEPRRARARGFRRR